MIRNPNPDDATRAVAWRMGYAMRYRLEFSTRRPWRTLLRDTAANRKRAWRAPLSLASRELIVSSGKFDLSSRYMPCAHACAVAGACCAGAVCSPCGKIGITLG